ncbi:MAG: glycosyltransferase family protein [Terriglobales bacterium]
MDRGRRSVLAWAALVAVNDGVEGFVVAVRDGQAMAAALEKLARSPGLRARMGAAARERVLREFTLETQVE